MFDAMHVLGTMLESGTAPSAAGRLSNAVQEGFGSGGLQDILGGLLGGGGQAAGGMGGMAGRLGGWIPRPSRRIWDNWPRGWECHQNSCRGFMNNSG